jgi:hypothetical protein
MQLRNFTFAFLLLLLLDHYSYEVVEFLANQILSILFVIVYDNGICKCCLHFLAIYAGSKR